MSQYTRLASTDLQEDAIRQIEGWLKKAKKHIVGADTIGKYPQTVILDLSYNGCEIYVHSDGFEDTELGSPGVTVYGEPVYNYEDFKNALANA